MKFSEAWLREAIDIPWTTAELVDQLTMAGLEVDGVEALGCGFEGVVVGEIVAVDPHPEVSRLSVCRVLGAGPQPLSIVCGAPNARAGLKTALAPIGAVLPDGRRIDAARLRGVESRGMLCAEAELGLSAEGDGLMELPTDAPTGADLRQLLRLDDTLIEVDLTPNRGDCLSIHGLAREVGAIAGRRPSAAPIAAVAPTCGDAVAIALQAPDACPRYCGRVIRDLDLTRPSPLWLRERLRRGGVRAINVAVDVTNYVMLELGQPMHAFDRDTLVGGIRVRFAADGERIALLDGAEAELRADTLVIADHDKALAVAGIMGGSGSAVTRETRHVLLESAYFSPLALAGRARGYGLHTDSSHRFERGVDPDLAVVAMERATQLLIEIADGKPGPLVVAEVGASLPQRPQVALRKRRLRQQLAMDFDDGLLRDLFARVGLEILAEDAEGWRCRMPSWRFDLAIEADLVEEVARLYGYNRLPTRTPVAPMAIVAAPERPASNRALRRFLSARDYDEAITYSFVDPQLQALIDPTQAVADIANPISSDMAVMRTSLWPGLLTAVRFNCHRQKTRVRLYETGLCFRVQAGELIQENRLGGVLAGRRHPESWVDASAAVDFFDAKGDLDALLGFLSGSMAVRYQPLSHPALQPGQAAAVIAGSGESLGCVGKLHPDIARRLGVEQDVFVFELALERIETGDRRQFAEISRFPRVRRDLAVLVDRSVTAGTLVDAVAGAAGGLLKELNVFDVYQGKHIENNRKSIAFGLVFQHPLRTMTEAEINAAIDGVVRMLKERFAASLRGEP